MDLTSDVLVLFMGIGIICTSILRLSGVIIDPILLTSLSLCATFIVLSDFFLMDSNGVKKIYWVYNCAGILCIASAGLSITFLPHTDLLKVSPEKLAAISDFSTLFSLGITLSMLVARKNKRKRTVDKKAELDTNTIQSNDY
ncbi:hypothetical protein [Brevibacillus laterosporus]|uniref:hypothetical protein n=1 Tax=Brevibacillus laterosporus TaxID=1465 RepID=UPI003D1C8A19